MNTKIAERNSAKRRKNLYTGLFLGWVALSAVWIWYISGICVPSHPENHDAVMPYPALLRQFSGNLLYNPFLALLVGLIVGGVLLYPTKNRWLGLALLPWLLFACVLGSISSSCIVNDASLIATVKFDGSIDYLLWVDDTGSWDMSTNALYLYTCDENGPNCRLQVIKRYTSTPFPRPSDLRLTVDSTHNQLQVINRDEVIYTLAPE
ncbi:MAG: hypothetical protein H6672_21905 [Anaerolineaceae bacterium]|nr:hypothetical protein [Anaerolineaceae bacterium]